MIEYANAQKYIQGNLIAVITRPMSASPGNYGAETETLNKAIKTLLERHALGISNLFTKFTIANIDAPNSDKHSLTMDYGNPIFEFLELTGKPVESVFIAWAKRIAMLNINKFKTIDVFFIEPDVTLTTVVNAWACFDLYPKNFYGIEGKRDLSKPHSDVKYRVEFDSLVVHNEKIIELAQKELDRLNECVG